MGTCEIQSTLLLIPSAISDWAYFYFLLWDWRNNRHIGDSEVIQNHLQNFKVTLMLKGQILLPE